MRQDLEASWQVVAEGAQTILRAAGVADAYERVKELTRGRELTRAGYERWIDSLQVEEQVKERLRGLTPFSYTGLAEQIASEILGD